MLTGIISSILVVRKIYLIEILDRLPKNAITMTIWGIVIVVGIILLIRKGQLSEYADVSWQLVHLVRQAHAGEPFQTLWNIEVSDEMRVALQAPLTPQQVRVMDEAEAGSFRKSVTCYLSSHKMEDKLLTGVVSVSIDIESSSGIYDYHVSEAQLRVSVERIGDRIDGKWVLRSVEQIQ